SRPRRWATSARKTPEARFCGPRLNRRRGPVLCARQPQTLARCGQMGYDKTKRDRRRPGDGRAGQKEQTMRYCKKCTMPDTRPGITFDAEGVCSACRHYEHRKQVDWDARFKEFEALCDKYRGCNGPGGYDCAVAVSGGKDSHFQVWMLKEVMHMNPILFSVEDNIPMTQAGVHNLKNISEEFGCTIISCKPNIKVQKILMRKFFEKYGKPTWY